MSEYIDKDKVLEYIIFEVVGKDITCGELKRGIESLPTIEVSLDCISRQQAVEMVHKYFVDAIDKTPHEIDEDGDEVYTDTKAVNELLKHNKHISKAIKALPPVTPTEHKTTETMIVDGMAMEIDPVSYEIGYSHGQVAPTEQQEHGRLIDADAFIESIKQSADYKNDIEYLMYANSFIDCINNAPTVTTPTERTGEWEEVQGCKSYLCCSECGRFVNVAHKCNFCPNCGAKMGGDVE